MANKCTSSSPESKRTYYAGIEKKKKPKGVLKGKTKKVRREEGAKRMWR